MAYEHVIFEREEHIAVITLNRPEKLNAFSPSMTEGVTKTLDELRDDEECRVVILTGAGDGFCTGADVAGLLRRAERQPALPPSVASRLNWESIPGIAVKIRQMEKPVIAAVNGVTAGGGFGVALACDIRIASERARFTQIFVDRGIIPDTGSTYFLPRLVGPAKACELMFTAEIIDAQEALRIGLVNRVVPHQALLEEAKELAHRIASKPPLAIRLTKSAIYRGLETDLISSIHHESAVQSILFDTEDVREGTRSFLEKRKPLFVGR